MQHYYLLGSPISHSLSPAMHNTAFRCLSLDADYGLCETDEASLPAVVRRLQETGASGWNVTMPCKMAMCALCDEVSLAASLGGAVNTVIHRDGRLIGDTTDGIGFIHAAEAAGMAVRGGRLLILGSGGAASAILIASALGGAESIRVVTNRPSSRERAEILLASLREVSDTDLSVLSFSEIEKLKAACLTSSLIVNATKLGMSGPLENENPLPDISFLASRPDVYDIVYQPRRTPLLAMAEQAGCRTENGLSMLLMQGAESFRLWTGRDMPVPEVRREVFGD